MILDSVKTVQAVTGGAAFTSYVHAQTYGDTKDDYVFGLLTGTSVLLAFLGLLTATVLSGDLYLLDQHSHEPVQQYMENGIYAIMATLVLNGSSLILMGVALCWLAFMAYKIQTALILAAFGFSSLVAFFTVRIQTACFLVQYYTKNPQRSSGE